MKVFKLLTLSLATTLLVGCFTVNAFALGDLFSGAGDRDSNSNEGNVSADTGESSAENSALTWVEENVSVSGDSIVSTSAWVKNFLTTNPDDASSATPYATLDGTQVYIKKGKTQSELESQVQKNINNDATVGNMTAMTDNLGINADLTGASDILSGFIPFIELIVGVLITLITLGMTLFSAFDIAYIAFPVFRNKCEEAKTNGGNNVMTKTKANGESALRFVTDDAQFAVQQGSVESGKSPWAIYFKKRVMSYILLAIILFILMTGNISLITNIALRVVSGIMNVLSGLA